MLWISTLHCFSIAALWDFEGRVAPVSQLAQPHWLGASGGGPGFSAEGRTDYMHTQWWHSTDTIMVASGGNVRALT